MRWLFALALLLAAAPARAEDTLPAIPPGDDRIVPLRKGQTVPFDGQLFDTNTAIRWGLWLQQYKARAGLERERLEQLCRAELDFKDRTLEIYREKHETIELDLKERLRRVDEQLKKSEYELANPAWYETGTFHFALGVVTSGALVWVGTRVLN